MIFKKDTVLCVVIFLFAFLFRVITAINYHVPLAGDEVSYDTLAVSMFQHETSHENMDSSRPPVYSFFMSIIYFLFGHKLIAVRIAQAAIDSLMCVFIYKLCLKLFNRRIALVTSFTSAVYLVFIKATTHILTESLFTFFLFLSVFYIFKTKKVLTYKNAAIVGILTAICVLVKGVTILFLPFVFVIILAIRFYHPVRTKIVFQKFIVAFIAFLIPLSFWTYRNYRLYHECVPLSTQGGYVLYDSYFPRDGKIYGVTIWDENVKYALTLKSDVKASRYLTGKTIEFIKKNPAKVVRLELLKIGYFWIPFDWEMMGVGKGLYNYQYMIILPFSLFGMFLLFKRLDEYAPLYIPIAYIFLMSLIFYGSPRFRMPVEPYLIIFFAAGIFKFFEYFKNKYLPAAISLSYAALNFIMYLNNDLIKETMKNAFVSMRLW